MVTVKLFTSHYRILHRRVSRALWFVKELGDPTRIEVDGASTIESREGRKTAKENRRGDAAVEMQL